MDRRTLLRRACLVGSVGIAGCTGGGPTTGSPTSTVIVTPTPTPVGDPTSTGQGSGDQTGTAPEATTTTETPTEMARNSPTESQSATSTEEPSTQTSTRSPTPTTTVAQEVAVGPNGTLRFEPQTFTISAGDTVLWIWESGGHNVSPGEAGQPADANWPGEDEETYDEGHEYAYTFDIAGEYGYHCDPHQSLGMTGSFTVEG